MRVIENNSNAMILINILVKYLIRDKYSFNIQD